MYFYTDLGRGNGLAGVNVDTGTTERSIRMGAPDAHFLSDEIDGLLYAREIIAWSHYDLNARD